MCTYIDIRRNECAAIYLTMNVLHSCPTSQSVMINLEMCLFIHNWLRLFTINRIRRFKTVQFFLTAAKNWNGNKEQLFHILFKEILQFTRTQSISRTTSELLTYKTQFLSRETVGAKSKIFISTRCSPSDFNLLPYFFWSKYLHFSTRVVKCAMFSRCPRKYFVLWRTPGRIPFSVVGWLTDWPTD